MPLAKGKKAVEISKNDFFIEYLREKESTSMSKEHFHRAYEIYYQVSGERNYFIEDKVYGVKKGDLVLIDVYSLHKTTSSSTPKYGRILINFSREFAAASLREDDPDLFCSFSGEKNVLSLDDGQQAYVSGLLMRMLQEGEGDKIGRELLIRGLLTELLVFIRRSAGAAGRGSRPLKSGIHREISLATRYINENYAQKLSLRELAKLCSVSYCYFCRMFRAVTGFTLTEYVSGVRVRKAQQLLGETARSVTDIAESVGFESTADFERVFKKITQSSPGQFRKLRRKK